MHTGNLPTKATIEASPVGPPAFRLEGRRDRVLPELDTLGPAIDRIVEATGINTGALRLLVVTSDMSSTARYWQEQLGRTANGVTELSGEGAAVGGKTFVWGGGISEGPFAVVALWAELLNALAAGNEYGIALLAHELGHVDDDTRRIRHAGLCPERPPPSLDDWPGLVACMSNLLWSECAANVVARRFMSEEMLAGDLEHWRTLLARRVAVVDAAITAYRTSRDLIQLWQIARQQVGVLLAQLGRNIGEVVGDEGAAVTLMSATRDTAPAWAPVVEAALEVLSELVEGVYADHLAEGWTVGVLRPVVERAFTAVGVLPKLVDGQLALDVPPRGDRERRLEAAARAYWEGR